MKPWVEPYLKKLMPDPCLRLAYEKYIEILNFVEVVEEKYWGNAPCDKLKEKIYTDISLLSHLLDPNSGKMRKTEPYTFAVHYDFSDPQAIDKGLHLYEHTPDYLRWLLDRMIEEEFHEGIVLVLHRLEEMGEESNAERFDL